MGIYSAVATVMVVTVSVIETMMVIMTIQIE